MSEFDMCIDYKRKFGIRFAKHMKGEFQLGLFFNHHCYGTYAGDMYEDYLYICFFKWNISIGWFLVS